MESQKILSGQVLVHDEDNVALTGIIILYRMVHRRAVCNDNIMS